MKLKSEFKAHQALVTHLCFSPTETLLASVSHDDTVKMWSLEKEVREVFCLSEYQRVGSAMMFSDDGSMLYVGGFGRILVVDVANGNVGREIDAHHGWVFACAPTDGHKSVVSTGLDRHVRVWDVESCEKVFESKRLSEGPQNLVISPDGKTWALTLGTTIRLWDAQSRGEVAVLKTHSRRIHSLAYSPDGTMLASGAADKKIVLWDVAAGEDVGALLGHENEVGCVAWSSNGRIIASAAMDGTVRLWDAKSHRILETILVEDPPDPVANAVGTVALSVEGTLLASATEGGVIKVFDIGGLFGKGK